MSCKAFADPRVSSDSDDEEVDSIKDNLKSVINSAPGEISDAYDANDMLPGLIIWRQYLKAHKATSEHLAWKQWMQSLGRESLDAHSCFIEFFQFVQIRSMSEAICETVGSIMNIQTGSGRHLQPVNFSA